MNSQRIQILNELLTGVHVNPDYAKRICGCTRLASRVGEIEDMGYVVKREMIKVPTRNGYTRVCSYWIESKVEPKVKFDSIGQVVLFVEIDMREIKFRVWDTMQKRFFNRASGFIREDGLFLIDLDPTGINMQGRIRIGVRNQYEFAGMYTGLKDKNGKEIYEGDVVRIKECECIGHSADGSEEEWSDCEGEVLFEDGMFVFDGHSAGTLPMSAYKDSFEVIGNIYENPKPLTL